MSLLPIPFAGLCNLSSANVDLNIGDQIFADDRAVVCVRLAHAGALAFGRIRSLRASAAQPSRQIVADILSRWLEQGEQVLGSIGGEFLLALWNSERSRALLAVDRFSTYPLFWAERAGAVGFSARPEHAAKLAGVPVEINWQGILDYAYFHMIPAPHSIYQGVRRLDLGEALRIEGGRAEVIRYWNPVFDEHRPFVFATERDAFLDALDEGVEECTSGLGRDEVGCFLSGGTDSSTIAGLVTRRYQAPARTFSIGFGVPGYDESEYSRLASRHFGTEHTEYFVTPDDVLAGVDAVATQFEQPFGNSSALPTFLCARLAREAGVRRMLGGDGGDEVYGGNERYAKQATFAAYRYVPELVRRNVIEPILWGPLKNTNVKLIAKCRSYVDQANQPLPNRLQGRYNLLNRLGADIMFTDALLDQVDRDQPIVLERDIWARARATREPMSQINQLLAWDFKFTLADNDLPKVTRMCLAAGVQVSFPMLTHALVQHSLHLQPSQKLKGRTLRYFFKESLRGFLPDEIITKKKHGFGLPFGGWLLQNENLRRVGYDALRSLATRGIIRREVLQQLLTQVETGHAGYYGTMVWVLMVLELWLRASPLADVRLDAP